MVAAKSLALRETRTLAVVRSRTKTGSRPTVSFPRVTDPERSADPVLAEAPGLTASARDNALVHGTRSRFLWPRQQAYRSSFLSWPWERCAWPGCTSRRPPSTNGRSRSR